MKNSISFKDAKFSTAEARCEWMAQSVLSCVPHGEPVRILDLGCGTGGLIFAMAPHLPLAEFVGIDISESNIEQARALAENSEHRDRLDFQAVGYLGSSLGTFDVIVSDNALHLIEGTDEEVFGKIDRDLKPGGSLIYTMPYRCLHNSLLLLVRRTASLLRGRYLDAIIIATAKLVFGNRYSTDFLRERVAYMYVIPYRLHDPQLVQSLAQKYDLILDREERTPDGALGKPLHEIAFYRKSAAVNRN